MSNTIEHYGSSRTGRGREVVINGRSEPVEGLDLRLLGCPDWLARKVDVWRVERRNRSTHAPLNPNSPIADEIRRTRLAAAGELVRMDAAETARAESDARIAARDLKVLDLQQEKRMATCAGNWSRVHQIERLLEQEK